MSPSSERALRARPIARIPAGESKGAEIPEIVCFEKQSDWGGLWNYTGARASMNMASWFIPACTAICGRMDRRNALEFADYTFDHHFKQPIPSFPPREVLYDYITGRAKDAGVRPWIQFNTAVRHVTYDKNSGKFSLTFERLTDRTLHTGHVRLGGRGDRPFLVPNVPHFPASSRSPAASCTATTSAAPTNSSGKDVLIVGASYSAEDIGLQCHKYGAKSVTMCWRTQAMGFHWPETMDERPLLTKIEGRKVFFKDGSSKDFDAIILCTGYQHHFPFLADELKLAHA